MRKQEYERQQALILQQQIAIDYLLTHSQIDRKNKNYPLTEKVLHGSPEELQAILSNELLNPDKLEINPFDFPEGLVFNRGERFFDIYMP
jgi:hypothetical protein